MCENCREIRRGFVHVTWKQDVFFLYNAQLYLYSPQGQHKTAKYKVEKTTGFMRTTRHMP